MSRKNYIGVILLLVGFILFVVGALSVFVGREGVSPDLTRPVLDDEIVRVVEPKLLVNLPAPGSIASSPLLVRGRIYGAEERVNLKLWSGGDLLVEKEIEVDGYGMDKELTELLEFEIPEGKEGRLEVSLVGDGGKIVTKEVVPLIFR